MNTRRLAAPALFLATLLAPPTVLADKNGLYKAAIPPGNAGVRIFNAGAPISSGKAKFGERYVGGLQTGEVSPYLTVVAGGRSLSCGNKSIMADIEEGKFYTLICGGPHEGSLLSDPQPSNQGKTFVIFYNLSQQDGVKLMTSNGKLSVVNDTPPKGIGSREINPVRVEFGVFGKGNQNLFDIGQVAFAPERIYSIFVTQVAGEVRAYVRESYIASET
ncbi:MAG: hypothetical protein K0S16_394 [Moraxellaceae bacterium]|nr:hypothetical protein [Moraxellaceae bacterium]